MENKLFAFMKGKHNVTLAISAPDQATAKALVDETIAQGTRLWEISSAELCDSKMNQSQVEQLRVRTKSQLLDDPRDPAGKE